jgi:hypothetical protein
MAIRSLKSLQIGGGAIKNSSFLHKVAPHRLIVSQKMRNFPAKFGFGGSRAGEKLDFSLRMDFRTSKLRLPHFH